MPRRINDDERLRRLEAVTDATLSRLDVSDLLDELLDRVRDLLDVDTAAILLLDEHARQLVATAAKGLEEEVREGFRVAVGQGFAGRIAATRRPVRLPDVTEGDVVNPLLLEKGIRSLLGVPIVAGADLIGVLHIGSLSRRDFSDDDVALLELVADRAGLAGRIRSAKLEQQAALALQRSLLPARLPEVPGVELAARYVPGHAAGVGGDWYDVFLLPSGWLGVVIGDVSGHGLASAVVMGRIRSALRAYAMICDDPAQALTLLDRKVQHFEAGSLTTALYVMVSPSRDRVVLSSAGHLRPVVAVPGRPAMLADCIVDPPLGVGRHARSRRSSTLALVPGAVLLCYTDGLVERRDQVIDIGLDRLTGTVRAAPAEDVCVTVMADAGVDQPADDVAVLALRRHP
ncbi:putative magnesium/manganese-dependent protein phosphatase [Actinoplanes missouriensis 431]|uniref:Putative magnesium/manganese-dependent protein phosphatase n=1 Tax=Actinoplanes missouriensis (strain ATCC 14538 / DSM 43046 / CBS 188.64 / JCM 3121 / NBRC 102363 / NCIMB 12654 / NRRL B-3342 / UNCC 431) TaxID=512565 RepID=I0H7K6_ACTM4|nr:GAF domain-containing SpoIIE family protein phosphatase [Actinoplanes missouriensis]BAL88993.1 putative magnesium/manganese-dependent protein phosphatase [Actinoplanes missouriensis 431]